MSPRVIQFPLSGRDRRHYVRELHAGESAHRALVIQVEDAYRTAHGLLCQEWNTRQFIGGPAEPSPMLDQAIHGGYVLLEVRCQRCGHESLVNLTEVVWPRQNQVCSLAKVLRCRSCRDQRRKPAVELVALRMRPGPEDAPARRADSAR